MNIFLGIITGLLSLFVRFVLGVLFIVGVLIVCVLLPFQVLWEIGEGMVQEIRDLTG